MELNELARVHSPHLGSLTNSKALVSLLLGVRNGCETHEHLENCKTLGKCLRNHYSFTGEKASGHKLPSSPTVSGLCLFSHPWFTLRTSSYSPPPLSGPQPASPVGDSAPPGYFSSFSSGPLPHACPEHTQQHSICTTSFQPHLVFSAASAASYATNPKVTIIFLFSCLYLFSCIFISTTQHLPNFPIYLFQLHSISPVFLFFLSST